MRLIAGLFAVLISSSVFAQDLSIKADAAMNQAHSLLWEKFMSPYSFLYDYVGDHPTAKDCAQGRPNAIGWWSPIENGAMFTGLYLSAVCKRAERTKSETDRERARLLAQGLLRCAPVEAPGFVSRGVAADGKSYYPIGSEDQTAPWFHGLWRFLQTDIPTAEERELITDRLVEMAEALESNAWRCPCTGSFAKEYRGDFRGGRFLVAPCYLFMLRATYELTGDKIWLDRYQTALREVPPLRKDVDLQSDAQSDGNRSRLEICAEGFPPDEKWLPNITQNFAWIYVKCQYALWELERLETDASVRDGYRKGLQISADACRTAIKKAFDFQNDESKLNENQRLFGSDWRKVYSDWEEQKTLKDVMRVQGRRNNALFGARKGYERTFVTNPMACAAIVGIASRPEDKTLIESAVAHYDYSRMRLSEFFYACIGYEFVYEPETPFVR